jgi:NhaA family Na+:H+ antiporter
MTLFFFLIGLEVKRECLVGELNNLKKAMLPCVGAVGGMLIPTLIYLGFNWGSPEVNGWAIPTATDIAFSLAVLSLLGNHLPVGLKLFLTALAIFDDLGAIVIIAVFYTQAIHGLALAGALFVQLTLMGCHHFRFISPLLQGVLGILLWWLLLTAGVHPTLAGVLLAFTIPLKIEKKPGSHPLTQCIKTLHPWVTFGILPLFAFMNSGILLHDFFKNSMNPLSLGIAAGLFIGKPLGVFSFCWLALRCQLAQLPRSMNLSHLYGVALLCGIGFTMSFFIGFLSFDPHSFMNQTQMRVGILSGSLLSGLAGYGWLRRSRSRVIPLKIVA